MSSKQSPEDTANILVYQTENGQTRVEVRLHDETVWLTQQQLAELFQTTVPNISMHIRNIFDEGELKPEATIQNFLIVRQEGKRSVQRKIDHFNLDMIISVGYRVKSHVATRFRIWATQRLRDYLVKGFLLDDERFKRGKDGNYFDELLARIRDIRSSEKEFWRKVLDIYATSIDYDPSATATQTFFATVQNKMHWAVHGHTAAEIVHSRADASQHNMGLASFPAGQTLPRKADVTVAKNYLNAEELDQLNRIVNLYLEFAELQAINRKPMYMKDWIGKLDQFLQISERDILTHAGKISAETAKLKAEQEYERYRRLLDDQPSAVESHFWEAVEQTRQLGKKQKPTDKSGDKR